MNYILSTRELTLYKELATIIMKHLEANSEFALWVIKYLTKNKEILYKHLIYQGFGSSNQSTIEMINTALKSVTHVEADYLISRKQTKEGIYKSAVIRLFNLLILEGLECARAHWQKSYCFFQLFKVFASNGEREVKFLVNSSLIERLIDYVSNTKASLIDEEKRRFEIGCNFIEPIKVLSTLICSGVTSNMIKIGKTPNGPLPKEYIELPMEQIKLFISSEWNFMKLIEHNKQPLIGILTHLCWHNQEFLLKAISMNTDYIIANRTSERYNTSLELFYNLLKTPGTSEELKLKEAFLKEPNTSCLMNCLVENQSESPIFVLDILCVLCKLVSEKVNVKKVLGKRLDWIPKFVRESHESFELVCAKILLDPERKKQRELIVEVLINA